MPRGFNGMCRKGLHDLTVPGSKNKDGGCRVCWNAYQSEYRKNNRIARDKYREIMAILQAENQTED